MCIIRPISPTGMSVPREAADRKAKSTNMRSNIAIVWFRHDLRLSDHPALHAAIRHGCVVPLFIWSPEEEREWSPGSASRWWLHRSLQSLEQQLRKRGSRLIIREGPSQAILGELVEATGASAVYWNRRYEPAVVQRDLEVKESLSAEGILAETFNGSLLFEPETIANKSGRPFQVFTPFWKTCLSIDPGAVLPTPRKIPGPRTWPDSLDLASLGLEPRVDWASGIASTWKPGCHVAGKRLQAFVRSGLSRYHLDRSRLDVKGSSMLSPFLRFGELSPRQVWHSVLKPQASCPEAVDVFLSEIGWREFAYHLLHHFPETTTNPMRSEFNRFPWSTHAATLRKWQRGRTGYPIVDAAMRQLWTTGWMPNRARMIVASFLTKDLMIPWQQGAKWFWDTLVDADLANNTLGWQWTAGCGADAAPFFRIFNPVAQAEKFDPAGHYIRRWVPEIASLRVPWIFRPWEAPEHGLRSCNVRIGTTYPKPIVDHSVARQRALESYRRIRTRRERGLPLIRHAKTRPASRSKRRSEQKGSF